MNDKFKWMINSNEWSILEPDAKSVVWMMNRWYPLQNRLQSLL